MPLGLPLQRDVDIGTLLAIVVTNTTKPTIRSYPSLTSRAVGPARGGHVEGVPADARRVSSIWTAFEGGPSTCGSFFFCLPRSRCSPSPAQSPRRRRQRSRSRRPATCRAPQDQPGRLGAVHEQRHGRPSDRLQDDDGHHVFARIPSSCSRVRAAPARSRTPARRRSPIRTRRATPSAGRSPSAAVADALTLVTSLRSVVYGGHVTLSALLSSHKVGENVDVFALGCGTSGRGQGRDRADDDERRVQRVRAAAPQHVVHRQGQEHDQRGDARDGSPEAPSRKTAAHRFAPARLGLDDVRRQVHELPALHRLPLDLRAVGAPPQQPDRRALPR